MSRSMMQNKARIFPRRISKRITKLEYPKFKYFAGNNPVKAFVCYMNEEHVMVYIQRPMTQKYQNHLLNVGKRCQDFMEFYPNKIAWSKVATRFRRPTSEADRTNADTRVGFKSGNKYLVKAYFTFGQQTVKKGTAHVFQTLNVPLLIFLMDKKLRVEEGLFPYQDIHLYDRCILKPHGCYRIPPGTTYLIFSTQKNFFSFDVVYENMPCFEYCRDPTVDRDRKIEGIFNEPPKTPYIGGDDEEEEEDFIDVFPQAAEPLNVKNLDELTAQTLGLSAQTFAEEQRTFAEEPQTFAEEPQTFAEEPQTFAEEPQTFAEEPQTLKNLEEPFPLQPFPLQPFPLQPFAYQPFPLQPFVHQPFAHQTFARQSFSNQTFAHQIFAPLDSEQKDFFPARIIEPGKITYYMIPRPPIFEKEIVISDTDFVGNFQKLKRIRTTDPNLAVYPDPDVPCPEPLDLSCNILQLDEIQDFEIPDDMDEMMQDLCESV